MEEINRSAEMWKRSQSLDMLNSRLPIITSLTRLGVHSDQVIVIGLDIKDDAAALENTRPLDSSFLRPKASR